MYQSFRRWLQDLHILDSVTHQQAMLLQILLIGMLLTVALAILLNIVVFGAAALTLSGLGPNLLVLLCIAGALLVLRRGRVRLSVGIVVVVLLIGQSYALLTGGVQHNPGQLLVFMIPIVLAGLLLGRAALIATAGLSILITIAAIELEQSGLLINEVPNIPVGGTFVLFVLIVGLLVLFLDRFGSVLRSALASATALADDNERLYRVAQEQQARLQATLASIGDAVITADIAGQITFLNTVAERLTGWAPADAVGKPLRDVFRVVSEDTREVVSSPLDALLREGIVVGLANHTLLLARDGREIPIDDSGASIRDDDGTIIGVVLTFRDITERKEAEERKRALVEVSSQLNDSLDYETTMHQIVDFFVPQFADYCLLHVVEEPEHCRLAAAAHADPGKQALLGELGRLDQFGSDAASSLIAQVLQTGRPALRSTMAGVEVDSIGTGADAQRIYRALNPVSLVIVPLIARGQVRGALTLAAAESGRQYDRRDLAFVEDLASHCALALDNAGLYREAQRAIVVRDQFLAIASHELKTPLTAMLGYTQLLQRRNERERLLGERDTRALTTIATQSARLEGLVNLLLDLSRIETGHLELETAPLDLVALVRRLVEDVRPSLDQHALTFIEPGEQLIVVGDELRLEQVIQNLLQNAIKYSPNGGAVTVRVAREGTVASIAVSDEGIGIPESAMPNLFRRFYRAPNVNPLHISGTGIGLYVVREIVGLHGGTVEVTSAEGAGSTFRVTLPLRAGESSDGATP